MTREEIEALVDARIEAAIGTMSEYIRHRQSQAAKARKAAKDAEVTAFRNGTAEERAATLRSLQVAHRPLLMATLFDREDAAVVALAVIADLPEDARRIAVEASRASHPFNYAKVVVALAPAVPRVRLTLNRGVSLSSGGMKITEAQFAALKAAGVGELQRTEAEAGLYYLGFRIEAPPNGQQSMHIETTSAWTARLEVDERLAKAVADGTVTVSALTDTESRRRTLEEYNAGQTPLPELPPAVDSPRQKGRAFRFDVGPGFGVGTLGEG